MGPPETEGWQPARSACVPRFATRGVLLGRRRPAAECAPYILRLTCF